MLRVFAKEFSYVVQHMILIIVKGFADIHTVYRRLVLGRN